MLRFQIRCHHAIINGIGHADIEQLLMRRWVRQSNQHRLVQVINMGFSPQWLAVTIQQHRHQTIGPVFSPSLPTRSRKLGPPN